MQFGVDYFIHYDCIFEYVKFNMVQKWKDTLVNSHSQHYLNTIFSHCLMVMIFIILIFISLGRIMSTKIARAYIVFSFLPFFFSLKNGGIWSHLPFMFFT